MNRPEFDIIHMVPFPAHPMILESPGCPPHTRRIFFQHIGSRPGVIVCKPFASPGAWLSLNDLGVDNAKGWHDGEKWGIRFTEREPDGVAVFDTDGVGVNDWLEKCRGPLAETNKPLHAVLNSLGSDLVTVMELGSFSQIEGPLQSIFGSAVALGKPGVNLWRIIEVPVEVVIKIKSDILCGHVIYRMGVHALKLTRTSPDIL